MRKPGARLPWSNILTVDKTSQLLLMERILFLHKISVAGASSKSQVLRLASWEKEIDFCCVVSHVLAEMQKEAMSSSPCAISHHT